VREATLKPHISVITIDVDDMERSVRFYRDGLGLKTAVIVKAAHDTFWGGYAGYFQDPDRRLWEVAWNPARVVRD